PQHAQQDARGDREHRAQAFAGGVARPEGVQGPGDHTVLHRYPTALARSPTRRSTPSPLTVAPGVNPVRTTTRSAEGTTTMYCPSCPEAQKASSGMSGRRGAPSPAVLVHHWAP